MTAATRRAPRPPARAPLNGLLTHAPVDSSGEKPLAATRAPHMCTSYDGYLDYVLTQKLCIGSTNGSPGDNKDVFSNKCYNTKYTVEYLSNQY